MIVKSPIPNGGISLQAISSSSKNVPSGQAHSPRMARVGTPPNHPELNPVLRISQSSQRILHDSNFQNLYPAYAPAATNATFLTFLKFLAFTLLVALNTLLAPERSGFEWEWLNPPPPFLGIAETKANIKTNKINKVIFMLLSHCSHSLNIYPM